MTRPSIEIEKRNVSAGTKAKICTITGCSRVKKSLGLCEVHYLRQRRTGSPLGRQPAEVRTNSAGYLMVMATGHPLRRGKVGPREYQHRVVFYDANGEGPFACHVCGNSVGWATMHVDHLNDDVADNRLENLAPACPVCNQARGKHKVLATMREKHATIVSFNGESLPIGDWALRLGISRESLRARLARWPLHRAMTEARGPTGPRGGK